MKKLASITLVSVMAVSLALAGCAKKSTDGGTTGNNVTGSKFKIGMVTDVGGVNDNSFNQSAWEGLQQFKKDTGTQVQYLQSKGDTDYVPNLNQFAKDGYNLTWGIGFTIGDAMKTAATQNPKLNFAIIDNVVDAPNVESVTFAENEGAYLVGVVAGLMTKTNKIGFVGGAEIPVIKRFEVGFKAGVAAVNPKAEVKVNYTGAFDKPDLGKSAAASIYNYGADIIFPAAGATGDGVFNEAKGRLKSGKVWVIGVDKDQSLTFGDDVTLTSMMKRVDQAIISVSNDLINGKFQGGKSVVLGLKDNGVGLPETSKKNVPEDVLKKVDEYKDKIVKGDIKVPTE